MAFCRNCGTPLIPGQKFCANCGQSVFLTEGTTPTQKAPTPPAPTAPPPPPPRMSQLHAPRMTPPPPPVQGITPPSQVQRGTPPPPLQRQTPPTQRLTPPPPPQPAVTLSVNRPAVPPSAPFERTVSKAATTLTSMIGGSNIMASDKPGEWVVSSWEPTLPPSFTSLSSKVKNFFIPERKLAYAWFLLPVATIAYTIFSYISYLIG